MNSNHGPGGRNAGCGLLEIRRAVRRLRKRGLAVCRVDPREKKPTYAGWNTASLEPGGFGPGDQIGILAGPLSDGNRPGHALVTIAIALDARRAAEGRS